MSHVFPLLASEISTTDDKLASTSLRIGFFCTVFYFCYLEVAFLASPVAAQVIGVKTTTDRKCFISITWISREFCISIKFDNCVSVLLCTFFLSICLEPETSTSGSKPFNLQLYCIISCYKVSVHFILIDLMCSSHIAQRA